MQDRSDDDLAKARGRIVLEITELNDQIGGAPRNDTRRARELQRDLRYDELKNIDREFERRGLTPRNS